MWRFKCRRWNSFSFIHDYKYGQTLFSSHMVPCVLTGMRRFWNVSFVIQEVKQEVLRRWDGLMIHVQFIVWKLSSCLFTESDSWSRSRRLSSGGPERGKVIGRRTGEWHSFSIRHSRDVRIKSESSPVTLPGGKSFLYCISLNAVFNCWTSRTFDAPCSGLNTTHTLFTLLPHFKGPLLFLKTPLICF